jgi:hypothetical protein
MSKNHKRAQGLVPALRCARASAARGDFCRQNEAHFGQDYPFLEQDSPTDKPVEKWACASCFPKETNPAAVE